MRFAISKQSQSYTLGIYVINWGWPIANQWEVGIHIFQWNIGLELFR